MLRQATGYECGNTSLAAVARFFGRTCSPAEFARLANTTHAGTDHENMIAAALATGASVFVKSCGTRDELRFFASRKLPPIVGWWSMEQGDAHYNPRWTRRVRRKKDRGHYSVVNGVSEDAVTLMDPEDGDISIARATFDRIWYDTDTHRYTQVLRWYMVMNYGAYALRRRSWVAKIERPEPRLTSPNSLLGRRCATIQWWAQSGEHRISVGHSRLHPTSGSRCGWRTSSRAFTSRCKPRQRCPKSSLPSSATRHRGRRC